MCSFSVGVTSLELANAVKAACNARNTELKYQTGIPNLNGSRKLS